VKKEDSHISQVKMGAKLNLKTISMDKSETFGVGISLAE
jgi:hypothetical protein